MKKIKTFCAIILITVSMMGLKSVSNSSNIETTQMASAAAAAYMLNEGDNGTWSAGAGVIGLVGSGGIYYGAILAGAGPVGWLALGVVVL